MHELFKDKDPESEKDAIILVSNNSFQTLIDLMEPGEVTKE